MGKVKGIYGDAPSATRAQFDPSVAELQLINPPALFNSSRLFSQIIVAPEGRTVWIAGQIGCDNNSELVSPDKPAQIAQAFANLGAAIAAAGCEPQHCVRIAEYVVDYQEADIGPISEAIHELFDAGSYPTNTLIPVPRLGRDGALFEIEAQCILPN